MRRCALHKLLCDSSISQLVFDYGVSWEKLSEKASLTLNRFSRKMTDNVSDHCQAVSSLFVVVVVVV